MSENEIGHITRLTGQGESAIAVYRFHGSKAVQLAGQRLDLRRGRAISELPLNRIYYGFWLHDDVSELREDVVLSRIDQHLFEISFHGSLAVERSLRQWALDVGLKWQAGHEESQQSLLPKFKMDQEAWDALETLVGWSGSDEDNASLNTFVRSQMSAQLTKMVAPDPAVAVMLQASGIFETELERIAGLLNQPQAALYAVVSLRKTWSYGKFLIRPIKVLLTGKPNVGKSSLINALLGYSRSIVTPIAGTTRDLVTQDTLIDGWPFELMDSAGIRQAKDEIESAGIDKVSKARLNADIVVQVLDARIEPEPSNSKPVDITVWNKCDLLSADGVAGEAENRIATSATAGQGIAELLRLLSKLAAVKMERPEDWRTQPMVVCQTIDDWLAKFESKLRQQFEN